VPELQEQLQMRVETQAHEWEQTLHAHAWVQNWTEVCTDRGEDMDSAGGTGSVSLKRTLLE